MMRDKYQLLPIHTEFELESLKRSIKEHGVLVPILVDENGDTLDGHTRKSIATYLRLPCPEEQRRGLTEEQKYDLVLQLNATRRNLTDEQKRRLGAEAIARNPNRNDCEIADLIGVSHGFVSQVRDFICNCESPNDEQVMEYGFFPKQLRKLREKLAEAGAIGKRETVTTRDGRTLPMPATAKANRERIRRAIETNPAKSNRSIAKELGVGPATVDRERLSLSASASRSSGEREAREIPPLARAPEPPPKDRAALRDWLLDALEDALSDFGIGDEQLPRFADAFKQAAEIASAPMTEFAEAG